jgi:hypothetical protein
MIALISHAVRANDLVGAAAQPMKAPHLRRNITAPIAFIRRTRNSCIVYYALFILISYATFVSIFQTK